MRSSGSLIKPSSSFPVKLHELLDEAEKLHYLNAIISWQPHGRAFTVHNALLFLQVAKKKNFFKQTKYPSFQRQLNMYGFCRISTGVDKGAYHHKLFLRGDRDLCHMISRIRIKGTKVRAPASPANEPDFYSMSCLPPSRNHSGARQGRPNPSACQTWPSTSSGSALGLAMPENNAVVPGSFVEPSVGRDRKKDRTGVSGIESVFIEQPQDMVVQLQNYDAPEISVQPIVPVGEDQVKIGMISTLYVTEQTMEESTNMEHDMMGRNDSVMRLQGLRGRRLLSTSMANPGVMTANQQPCQITRSVSASSDRTRENEQDSNQVCKAALSRDVSDDLPFLLYLQLPTLRGKLNKSNGLTFVRAVHNHSTTSQVDHQIGGEFLIGKSQNNRSDDQFSLTWMHRVSNNGKEYSFFDETVGDDGLVLNQNLSNAGQQDSLGVEELPSDTELEEFIAFHMTGIDRN